MAIKYEQWLEETTHVTGFIGLIKQPESLGFDS